MTNDISETEKKIIDAATDIFLEKGKDGARMQEIANRAGINKALLHYYFRSKEKLFSKIFQTELPKVLMSIFGSIDEQADFREFLRHFISQYIDNIVPRRKMIRFVVWIGEKSEADLAQVLGKSFHEAFRSRGFEMNPFIQRINRAVSEGEIKAVDPVNLIFSVIGMCAFPIVAAPLLSKIFPGTDPLHEKFLENRKQYIFEIVWHGIKTETANNN